MRRRWIGRTWDHHGQMEYWLPETSYGNTTIQTYVASQEAVKAAEASETNFYLPSSTLNVEVPTNIHKILHYLPEPQELNLIPRLDAGTLVQRCQLPFATSILETVLRRLKKRSNQTRFGLSSKLSSGAISLASEAAAKLRSPFFFPPNCCDPAVSERSSVVA